MKNTRAFKVKYYGATNTKGSRVLIHDLRFVVKKFISYDHKQNNIYDMANNYLKTRGIVCEFVAEDVDGYLLMTNNFNNQIK